MFKNAAENREKNYSATKRGPGRQSARPPRRDTPRPGITKTARQYAKRFGGKGAIDEIARLFKRHPQTFVDHDSKTRAKLAIKSGIRP